VQEFVAKLHWSTHKMYPQQK